MTEFSLLMATRNNVGQLDTFLTTLAETAQHPEKIELLIKIDRDDEVMLDYCYNEKHKSLFPNVQYVISDRRDGYWSLGDAYNQLIVASNPESYFILILNDGVKFVYKGWDSEILQAKHHFKDDVFYIKTSKFKWEKYNGNVYNMVTKPDNYSFYTRKLISLMEGIGDYWSYDSWFQPILTTLEEKYGHERFLIFQDNLFDPQSQIESLKDPKSANRISHAFLRLIQEEYVNHTYDRIAKKIANYIESKKAA